MNHTLPQATTHWDIPAVCEFLRAVSGLVAIGVLTSIVVATTVFTWDSAEHGSSREAEARTPPETTDRPHSVIVSGTPSQAVLVFYLVATQQQASLADREEQVGAHEAISSGAYLADRYYHIHFARDEAEEREAGQAMLQRVLTHRDTAIVEVIDLRSTSGP